MKNDEVLIQLNISFKYKTIIPLTSYSDKITLKEILNNEIN